MLKNVFFVLLLFIIQSAFPNEVISESNNFHKQFIYLYTANCGYCVKFNPIYNKIEKSYKSRCKFLKVDANSQFGQKLMQEFNAYYVPYVVMLDNDKKTLQRLTPQCLLNYACIKDSVDKFLN